MNATKVWKRVLSIVLAVALVMSVTPVGTFMDVETDAATSTSMTVYFQNNWNWTDVRAHYWGGSETSGNWPGKAMTWVENDGTYDIYSIVLPSGTTGLIFNGIKDDGSGTRDQSPDITEIKSGVCYYMYWDSKNCVGTFEYPPTYDVDYTLSNLTSNGTNSATYKTNYTATLTAASGYTLPASITVKAGSTTLNKDTHYTYDSSTGAITIYGSAITGDITITAAGEEITANIYSVSLSGTGVTLDGASSATEGTEYTATLTAKAGCSLPTSITVKAGSAFLNSGIDFNYNSSTGAITIYGSAITGNITITASGMANTYNVNFDLTNVTKDSGDTTATYGSNYTAKLTVGTGYTLPSSITVKAGSATLTKGTDYTYSSGTVTIYGSAITGEITITATATLNKYTVTPTLSNVTMTGASTVNHGSAYSATLAAKSGYTLPSSITVKVGTTTLSSSQYSYNSSTGAITIDSGLVTDNITITASGIKIYTVAGTSSLCGVDWDTTQNQMTLNSDGTYSITFYGVAAGNHSFKVTDGTWTNAWGGSGTDGNYEFNLSSKSNVTITFNPTSKKIDVVSEKITSDVYIIAGTESLTGSDWSTTDTNNQMTKNEDGTYTIVYDNVPAGSHEFKVVQNGSTWIWPSESYGNYKLDLDVRSKVTITYNPSAGSSDNAGTVSIEKILTPDKYERVDEIKLNSGSVFYVDADIVDYINDDRVANGQIYGYYKNNQGIKTNRGDAPYSYLNDLISEQAGTYNNYTYPLYFGPLNYIESRYSRIVGTEDKYNSLAKWNSAVNVAMADSNGAINADATIQGLVGKELVDGNLVDPETGKTLLYFNEKAANEWTNQGGDYPVMAYYKDLQFPFKVSYDVDSRVTTYSYNSANDYAVYYDYSSKQLYASNTHILDSVADGDPDPENDDYGFYPLNMPTDKDNEVNNGFGVKFTINFTVGENGLVGEKNEDGQVTEDQHVKFNFTGDDDVWVFIDVKLVLDMGGAHGKANGSIDFFNKTATVVDAYTATTDGTISGVSNSSDTYFNLSKSWLYNGNTEERAAVTSGTKTATFESLGLLNDKGEFDSSAIHTMTVFYMERGMVESNFSMNFTMVPVPSGLTLSKELNDKEINAGLLKDISAAEDFNFNLSATSPSDTTSVAFQKYTLTEKYTGIHTGVLTPAPDAGTTDYVADITGITNYTYAHSFVTSNGDDAFIPGTIFSIVETTNGIFNYDESKTSWRVYDAKNGYSVVTSGSNDSANFQMGSANDNTAYSYAITFHNTMEVGNLEITKNFSDDVLGDTKFTFQVYLDLDGDKDNFSEKLYSGLVYTVDGTPVTSNDGTVILEGGQTAVISGIPADATYRVVEVISDSDPWTLTSDNNLKGNIVSGKTQAITFTNVVKSDTQDKVIFVEAGRHTDYSVKYDGETVTITNLTPSTGLDVKLDDTKTVITVTGADPDKAYTIDYSGRLENNEIITGTITVYTFAAADKVYVFDFGLSSNLAATNDNGNGLFQEGNYSNSLYNSTYSATGTIFLGLSTDPQGLTQITGELSEVTDGQTVISATTGYAIGEYGDKYPVTFRPVAFMNQVGTYYYTVQITVPGKTFKAGDPETGTTVTGTIQVMPANIVYYEDNFNASYTYSEEEAQSAPAHKIIYSDGVAKVPTSDPTMPQSNDQSTNYGYDDCYLYNETTLNGYAESNGSATELANGQYAYFTFSGTGFDLISRTNGSTAGFAVYVFTGTHSDANVKYMTSFSGTKPTKMVFVDTYYNNGDLHQVPVASVRLNSYGTYTVYVQALATSAKLTKVSVDGIRIYDPLKNTSLYPLKAEQNTTVDELRVLYGIDKIVNLAGRYNDYVFEGLGKQSIVEKVIESTSIVENMEDVNIATVTDLKSIYEHGPNNEMYLPTSFGIAFSYQVQSSDWTLQLGAKAVTATDEEKSFTIYARVSGGTYEAVGTIDLTSATDMYYDLSTWLSNYSSMGKTYDVIIISDSACKNNEFVSLTTVKHSGIELS